jgi:hypothetical protein
LREVFTSPVKLAVLLPVSVPFTVVFPLSVIPEPLTTIEELPIVMVTDAGASTNILAGVTTLIVFAACGLPELIVGPVILIKVVGSTVGNHPPT